MGDGPKVEIEKSDWHMRKNANCWMTFEKIREKFPRHIPEKNVKLGLLNKNVAKQVGNVKKQKKKIDFWTQKEFEKVISTFDISDYYEHYTFIIIVSCL